MDVSMYFLLLLQGLLLIALQKWLAAVLHQQYHIKKLPLSLQANLVLESPTAVRSRTAKEASFRMMAALALRYQQLDVAAGDLVDLLNKHEHLPAVLAELAAFAAQQYEDSRLVCLR